MRTDREGRALIPLELGAHEHAILRGAVRISPGVGVTGSARMALDDLAGGSLVASWAGAAADDGAILARIPRGATPTSFVLNGEERKFEAEDGAVRWGGVIPAECTLHVTWRPEVVVEATREQIAGFPFVTDGGPTATVCLPPAPDDRDRYLAEHLGIYFDYWQRHQTQPWGQVASLADVPPGPRLTVVLETFAPVTGPRVVFTETDYPSIGYQADGPVLTLAGPDSEGRERALRRLLGVLDERYPYFGAFPEHPMYAKAELVGRALD